MAKKPKFRADTSFNFGANRKPRKPGAKAKGKGKRGGRAFGS